MSTQLADALNDKNNITKTIKAGAAVPIEYTDPVWEDETFPFTQAKQGSADVPSFNFTDMGLEFDIHYQIDSPGSQDEYTK